MHPACLWCPRSNKQRFVYLPVDILSLKIRWQLLKCCFFYIFFLGGGPQRLQVWRPAVGRQHKKPIDDIQLTPVLCSCAIRRNHIGSVALAKPEIVASERRSEKCCLWKAGRCFFFYKLKWTLFNMFKKGNLRETTHPTILNHISYKACKRRSIYIYTCKFTHYKVAFPCFSDRYFSSSKCYSMSSSQHCSWSSITPHMPNIWQVTNVGQVLRKHLSHLEMSQSELKGRGKWSWHTFVCIRLSKSRQSSTILVMSSHDRTKRQTHIGWINLHEHLWHKLSPQVHVSDSGGKSNWLYIPWAPKTMKQMVLAT